MRLSQLPLDLRLIPLAACSLLPSGVHALQHEPVNPPVSVSDSSHLHDAAREEQARFERTRVRYASRTWSSSGGPCDERVGRMCIRFDDDGPREWDPPAEDSLVIEARYRFLGALQEIGRQIPGDPWVLGQRVVYLGEAGDWERARLLSSDCRLTHSARWWCSALEGVALHRLGRFEEAERAFGDALAGMPPDIAEEWLELESIVDSDLRDRFANATGDSLVALRDRLWTLGDPMFLVPGRDRMTEHFARHTLAHARTEARNPYRMRWGNDLREILIRYGPEVAYQQERDTRGLGRPTAAVVGHFHQAGAGFLPRESQFMYPTSVATGSWRTDDTRVRSQHVPLYSQLIRGLDVQQARFRRGDDLFVVLGWAAEGSDREGDAAHAESSPSAHTESSPAAGLFLLSESDLEPTGSTVVDVQPVGPGQIDGSGLRGVASARAPEGAYLLSLEVLDSSRERAWRARYGIVQDALAPGIVALSDLLLLEPDQAAPSGEPVTAREEDRLEAHVGRALPEAVAPDDRVEIAWEAYGLSGEEVLAFQVTAVPNDRGFGRKLGEFLRLVDAVSPVRIGWTETPRQEEAVGPESPLFRRMVIDFGSLPSGPTRLTVALEVAGRTPATSTVVIQRPER